MHRNFGRFDFPLVIYFVLGLCESRHFSSRVKSSHQHFRVESSQVIFAVFPFSVFLIKSVKENFFMTRYPVRVSYHLRPYEYIGKENLLKNNCFNAIYSVRTKIAASGFFLRNHSINCAIYFNIRRNSLGQGNVCHWGYRREQHWGLRPSWRWMLTLLSMSLLRYR